MQLVNRARRPRRLGAGTLLWLVSALICLFLASCGGEQSGTERDRAVTPSETTVRNAAQPKSSPDKTARAKFPVHAVAHLKAISQKGSVYVDRGSVTGTFDMTMTLTIDNGTGLGTFRATGADGSIRGKIHISTGSVQEQNGEQVFVFAGSGNIRGGTRRYRGQNATDLKMNGEIRFGGVFNMTLQGIAERTP